MDFSLCSAVSQNLKPLKNKYVNKDSQEFSKQLALGISGIAFEIYDNMLRKQWASLKCVPSP